MRRSLIREQLVNKNKFENEDIPAGAHFTRSGSALIAGFEKQNQPGAQVERAARIFGTHWFHRRFTLTPEGRYVTVTELAEWARGPYDQLQKNLLLHARRQTPPRTLLLAPVRHGDGTTTTAILLGASLATNHTCLLLDLNFRRPGLGLALGLDGTPGLAAVLHGAARVDVERAIVPTRVPGLFALPNTVDGGLRTLPELAAVKEVVDRVKERFAYVIMDTAPVLEYPDTPLFASLADAALLIMAADSTPVNGAIATRREIERTDTPIAGAVVTRQRRYVPAMVARRLGLSE